MVHGGSYRTQKKMRLQHHRTALRLEATGISNEVKAFREMELLSIDRREQTAIDCFTIYSIMAGLETSNCTTDQKS